MSDNYNTPNVWASYISTRKARNVARALKAAGYGTATIKRCTEYVMNVANYFEPMDTDARNKLVRLICEAAGIQPSQDTC